MTGKLSRHESGATLVEAAFALPILFLLLFGLIDFGIQAFENNQATNAARDGARVGVINYRYLDAANRGSDPKPAGSKDYELLKAAIEKNLPGRSIPDADLEVKCITPGGADVSCLSARVDVDRVSVRLEWERNSISPIAAALGFSTMTASGEARMTIIGAPVGGGGGSTPVPCAVSAMSVPSPVELTVGNLLAEDLTITSVYTGTCGNARLIVESPSGAITSLCESNCVGAYTHSKLSLTPSWSAGEWTARFLSSSGDSLRSSPFTVEDPIVPCVLNSVDVQGVSPPITSLATGFLSTDLVITIDAVGTCPNLAATLLPPGATAGVVACTNCPVGSSTYLANQDRVWTSPGSGTITVTGATNSVSGTFTVSDTPTCTLAGEVQYGPVARAGKRLKEISPPDSLRQRATIGSSGPCSTLTVRLVTPDGLLSSPLVQASDGKYEYRSDETIWTTSGTAVVRVSQPSGDFADVVAFAVS